MHGSPGMSVEDPALIGLSLEVSPEETGFKVAGPFVSSEPAPPSLSLVS